MSKRQGSVTSSSMLSTSRLRGLRRNSSGYDVCCPSCAKMWRRVLIQWPIDSSQLQINGLSFDNSRQNQYYWCCPKKRMFSERSRTNVVLQVIVIVNTAVVSTIKAFSMIASSKTSSGPDVLESAKRHSPTVLSPTPEYCNPPDHDLAQLVRIGNRCDVQV